MTWFGLIETLNLNLNWKNNWYLNINVEKLYRGEEAHYMRKHRGCSASTKIERKLGRLRG